uniref:HTH psq-type domain-containing protein n=1 Tax=Oreochromis aureus TaxID=47969 RepID=A0AAZ1XTB4_OREAU
MLRAPSKLYVRETTVAAYQSGKVYKVISKQFKVHHFTVSKIIHKWKPLKTAANLPSSGRLSKFTPRSEHAITLTLFSIRNTEAWLSFTKLHLNKPNDFCSNVVWTHDTKVETSGHNTAPHLTNSKYQLSTLLSRNI